LPFEKGLRERLLPNCRTVWLDSAASPCSHHIYGRGGSIVRLSIPVHGNQSLKPGLLRHLAKLADITEDEL